MKKQFLIVVILILVLLVVVFASRNVTPKNGNVKNVEMLDTGNSTPLAEESVAYFSGAIGYYVHPKAPGNYPGVVVIHENRGLRPEIKTMAEQLAREGYMVLAVDLFGGKVVETQDEAKILTASFNQDIGIENLKAAASYLRGKGATKIASLGWCFGGGQSLRIALSGELLDATIIYYGQLATTTAALSAIKWPVLGIFAGNDQSISAESVSQFHASLDTLGIKNEIYTYPGVGHAFANPSGMNYASKETMDAWTKTLAFLKMYLQ